MATTKVDHKLVILHETRFTVIICCEALATNEEIQAELAARRPCIDAKCWEQVQVEACPVDGAHHHITLEML